MTFFGRSVVLLVKDKKITLFNILARYNLSSQNRILLMAHWDTREIADLDKNKMNQNKNYLEVYCN